MKNQSEGLFFVQVRDPSEIRRNILETLRSILEMLQRFEKFRHIRHKKLDDINRLRSLLKDTNKMFGSLKLKLPQTNLRAAIAREAQTDRKPRHAKKKKMASEEEPKKAPKRGMTELEKLESELSAIEGKLKSLA